MLFISHDRHFLAAKRSAGVTALFDRERHYTVDPQSSRRDLVGASLSCKSTLHFSDYAFFTFRKDRRPRLGGLDLPADGDGRWPAISIC
ncbi:hypothetical protein [Bosea sp. (in: a-proteobacteria)]|uniref:hypothetical protein n=1 Tax=Bosea sp. (in: a-proteobacteria) TaxID=1871050 RepID=UPI0031FE69B7